MLLSLRDSGWLLAGLLLLASPTMSNLLSQGSEPSTAQQQTSSSVKMNPSSIHRCLLKSAHTEFLKYSSRLDHDPRFESGFGSRLNAAAFNSNGAILGKISRTDSSKQHRYLNSILNEIEGPVSAKNTGQDSMYRWMTPYENNYIGFSAQANVDLRLRNKARFDTNFHGHASTDPEFRAKAEFGPGFIRCSRSESRLFYPPRDIKGASLESIPRNHVDAPFFMPITTMLKISDQHCAITKTGDHPMPYVFYVVHIQEKLLAEQKLAQDAARNSNWQAKEEAERRMELYQIALTSLVKDLVSIVSRLQLKAYVIRTIQPETLMVSLWNDQLAITTLDNSWARKGAKVKTRATVFGSDGNDPLHRAMYKPPEMNLGKNEKVNAFAYDRWMVGITAFLTVDMDSAALVKEFNDQQLDVEVPAQLTPRVPRTPARHDDSKLVQMQRWILPLLHHQIPQRIWPTITAGRFADGFAFHQGCMSFFNEFDAVFRLPHSLKLSSGIPDEELFQLPPSLQASPGSPDEEIIQPLKALAPVELERIGRLQGVEQQIRLISLVIHVLHQRLVDPQKQLLQLKLKYFVLNHRRLMSEWQDYKLPAIPNQQLPPSHHDALDLQQSEPMSLEGAAEVLANMPHTRHPVGALPSAHQSRQPPVHRLYPSVQKYKSNTKAPSSDPYWYMLHRPPKHHSSRPSDYTGSAGTQGTGWSKGGNKRSRVDSSQPAMD